MLRNNPMDLFNTSIGFKAQIAAIYDTRESFNGRAARGIKAWWGHLRQAWVRCRQTTA